MTTTIPTLPAAPDRNDPATFPDRAQAWVFAIAAWTVAVNAFGGDMAAILASAQAAATSALNAPGTNASSTTANDIGTGSKTFAIQTGKAFSVGQTVVAAQTSAPGNQMQGVITAHNATTGALTFMSETTGGSGTALTDWTISIAARFVCAAKEEVRALTDPNKVITAKSMGDAIAWVALADAATIAIDLLAGMKRYVVLGGARTFGAPTNMVDGHDLALKFDCNGFLPSWSTAFDFGFTGPPSPNTTAGKIHYVFATYDAARGKWVANYKAPA